MVQPKEVVVFDVDGTLREDAFLELLVEAFIEKGFFNHKTAEDYMKEKMVWRQGGPYQSYVDALIQVFKKGISGVSYEGALKVAQEIIDDKSHRYYRFSKALLEKAKTKGSYTILLSHSPQFIITLLGGDLGVDKAVGTKYIVSDGLFTGEREVETGYDKGEKLKKVLKESGIKISKIQNLVCVGDSVPDYEMFRLANHAVLICPTANLRKLVRESMSNSSQSTPTFWRIMEAKSVVEVDGVEVENIDEYISQILTA